jgi:tetratricopeptide (TPR) repeat protein
MGHKHFISYSHLDGTDQAFALHDDLLTGVPVFECWLDKPDLRAGGIWSGGVSDAIADCETVLFLMTADSVTPNSICTNECSRALRFKKPLIPLLFKAGVTPPFLLETRQYIDFTRSVDVGMANLRKYLRRLNSPAGILDTLNDRLKDAQRDLSRASEKDRPRITADITQLQSDIARQQAIVANPEQAAAKTEQNIAQALERERKPVEPAVRPGVKLINPAPMGAPSHFQNRHVETKLLGDFLASDDRRIATVVGRGGTGKTAMACRLLKSLEQGQLPDDLGPLNVDGIVYLSGARIGPSRIFGDLIKLLPQADSDRLKMQEPGLQLNVVDLFTALLAAFPGGRTVLLLDNFETVVEEDRLVIRDPALLSALKTILDAPEHGVKVIITTRIAPKDLALIQPGRQTTLYLDKGLESPYAENVLRALDQDGTVGLKTASDAMLKVACERTRGFPRALEALYAILSSDRSTTLEEILAQSSALLPDSVVDVLVGEAFSRLDPAGQQILQALAIYAHPVPAEAVDYLLQPFQPAANSAPILNRLVNMQFARKERGRYFLHPVDREFAASRIPSSEPPPWNRQALLERAASYFAQVRIPLNKCNSLADLAAWQAEFDLRIAAGNYDAAASIVNLIWSRLDRWGHYRLIDLLFSRVMGKIRDPNIAMNSARWLAHTRMRLGDVVSSLRLLEDTLAFLRTHPNPVMEAYDKVDYGVYLSAVGQTEEAIVQIQDALKMARKRELCGLIMSSLLNLGHCYVHLGQIELSLSSISEAIQIARDLDDLGNETNLLNNWSVSLGHLGHLPLALEKAQEGLDKAILLKSPLFECGNRTNIGILLTDSNRFTEALGYLTRAVEIADEIASGQFKDESRQCLALCHFCMGDLTKARDVALQALPFSGRQQNHPLCGLLAFLGLLELRLNDPATAKQRFEAAVQEANNMLAKNPKHFAVLDIKGLALCGLAVCNKTSDLSEAVASYRAARALCKDAGIVMRALRLFDGLQAAQLNAIRHEVAGTAGG